jgi:hypothetical protein
VSVAPGTHVLFAPTDLSRCRALRIEARDRRTGPRIGGNGPEGQEAWDLPADTIYFGTFPLSRRPALELSIYARPFDAFVDAMNEGLRQDDLASCVVHPPARRGTSREHRSELSAHAVRIGRPRGDATRGEAQPFSGHKIGGRPYCIQEPELEGAAALMRRGFVHVLQIDFPGPEDGDVSGDWPFGDGLFNVLARPPFGPKDIRWAFQK